MPRHPPCALKNLTTHMQPTQHTTKVRHDLVLLIIERTTDTNTPKDAGTRFIHVSKKLLPLKRCSRSLCSSQTTTPQHTTPTTGHTPTRGRHTAPRDSHAQEKPETNNSRCCSRTQQCAKHHPPEHGQPFKERSTRPQSGRCTDSGSPRAGRHLSH